MCQLEPSLLFEKGNKTFCDLVFNVKRDAYFTHERKCDTYHKFNLGFNFLYALYLALNFPNPKENDEGKQLRTDRLSFVHLHINNIGWQTKQLQN